MRAVPTLLLWALALVFTGLVRTSEDKKKGDQKKERKVTGLMLDTVLQRIVQNEMPEVRLPELDIYFPATSVSGYFNAGKWSALSVKNAFYSHMDNFSGYSCVNAEFELREGDGFVDIVVSSVTGSVDSTLVSRMIFFFSGIISRDIDPTRLVQYNLARFTYTNGTMFGGTHLTFRLRKPENKQEYVKIFSAEFGASWLVGFTEPGDGSCPRTIFDEGEIMEVSAADNTSWSVYSKPGELFSHYNKLSHAIELILCLLDVYLIPDFSCFRDGHVKEDLTRVSLNISGADGKQVYFLIQFLRNCFAEVYTELINNYENSFSKIVGFDFEDKGRSMNIYFSAKVVPLEAIFELRELFYLLGLKFTYQFNPKVTVFKAGYLSGIGESVAVGSSSEYALRMVNYCEMVKTSSPLWKIPAVVKFGCKKDSRQTGFLMSKVTFKVTPEVCLDTLFNLLYGVLANFQMESIAVLPLVEFRLVPLKADQFTLSVALAKGANTSIQHVFVQQVLTMILRAAGIENEVFNGQMIDFDKKFTLVKYFPGEAAEKLAIHFKVSTKEERDKLLPPCIEQPVLQPSANKEATTTKKVQQPVISMKQLKRNACKTKRTHQRTSIAEESKPVSSKDSSEQVEVKPQNEVKGEPIIKPQTELDNTEKVEVKPQTEVEDESVHRPQSELNSTEKVEVKIQTEEKGEPVLEPQPEVEAELAQAPEAPIAPSITSAEEVKPEVQQPQKTKKIKASKRRRMENIANRRQQTSSIAKAAQAVEVQKDFTDASPEDDFQEESLQVLCERMVASVVPEEKSKDLPESKGEHLQSSITCPVLLEAFKEQDTMTEPASSSSQPLISDWFPPTNVESSQVSGGPIFGPTMSNVKADHQASTGIIFGPVMKKAASEIEKEKSSASVHLPVNKLPKDEPKTTVDSAASSKPSSQPNSSSKATSFIREGGSAGKLKADSPVFDYSKTFSALYKTEDFYPDPLILLTLPGQSLMEGHDVGTWSSFKELNLWANPYWTRSQSVHVIRKKLSDELMKGRFTSLMFPVTENLAGACLHDMVMWISTTADAHCKGRTVAVSIIGSSATADMSTTWLVFTIQSPHLGGNFSAYRHAMANYYSESESSMPVVRYREVYRPLCPLSESSIIDRPDPLEQNITWSIFKNSWHGLQCRTKAIPFTSLHVLGAWLKHIDPYVVTRNLQIVRNIIRSENSARDEHKLKIVGSSVEQVYEVLMVILETLEEDKWCSEGSMKYPFLNYTNFIAIQKCLTSDQYCLYFQISPAIPTSCLNATEDLFESISDGLELLQTLEVAPQKQKTLFDGSMWNLVPYYLIGRQKQPQVASRRLYNANARAYNQREVEGAEPPSMIIRLHDSLQENSNLNADEIIVVVQCIVSDPDSIMIGRLLNELFHLPKYVKSGLITPPRAFWHKKWTSQGDYVVGVAFSEAELKKRDSSSADAANFLAAMALLAGFTNVSSIHITRCSTIAWQSDIEDLVRHVQLFFGTFKDQDEVKAKEVRSPPQIPSTEYIPHVPTSVFTAKPHFIHSGTEWQMQYHVDDDVPITDLRIRVPSKSNGNFNGYVAAVMKKLQPGYWKKGYGFLIERLYSQTEKRELLDEPDVIHDLTVTGERPGDVIAVLIRLLTAAVLYKIPVDKICIVSLADPSKGQIRLVLLPSITFRQIGLLKKEARGDVAEWKQAWR